MCSELSHTNRYEMSSLCDVKLIARDVDPGGVTSVVMTLRLREPYLEKHLFLRGCGACYDESDCPLMSINLTNRAIH